MKKLDACYIKTRLHYEPDTGKLIWLPIAERSNHQRIWNNRFAGKEAGWVNSGYRRVCLDGRHFIAHRAAWVIQTGREPAQFVDHINGDKLDNRWCNLREATRRENNCNRASGSAIGMRNITKRHGRYRVQIGHMRQKLHIGTYDTLTAARDAYEAAAQRLHGEFAAHTSRQEGREKHINT